MVPKDTVSTPSASRSVTKTINGGHQFNISGYSLAKGMGIGRYMSSDTFTVGGYKWAIYFYPDGKNTEDNSQYVSLFIALASEGTDVRALFELNMIDQSGRGRHKVHSHFDRALESGPYTLKYKGSMWGYKRFFRRANLETSDYLKDDSLQINCTVGVVVTETEGPKEPLSIPVPPSQMGADFGSLLESEEGCDITFEVAGECFKAHRIIIAARSPVMKALLFGPMRVKEDRVPVEDVEPSIFKSLLQFVYMDDLPETGPMALTSITAQHLLAAADRYALDRLRLICEAKLCKSVDVETVATTLALAEQHNAMRLKDVCLKFAAQNLKDVIASEGFDHLRLSCPALQAELLQAVAGVTPLPETPTEGNLGPGVVVPSSGDVRGLEPEVLVGGGEIGGGGAGGVEGGDGDTVGGAVTTVGTRRPLELGWEDANPDGGDNNGRRVRFRLL